MPRQPTISLLTDFGLSDAYVGTMKAVMVNICPLANLVDISHGIQPQNIRQAAFELLTAAPFFPPNTVHLAVIDPGVGSSRRAIAVESPTARYVAPDNGLLSWALAREESFQAVELTNPSYRLSNSSSTFHGRDIFSPAAAHLAAGLPLEKLGPPIKNLVLLEDPFLQIMKYRIEAEVLNIDHFGNLRTSLMALTWENTDTLKLSPFFGDQTPSLLPAQGTTIRVRSREIHGIASTFGDVPPGRPVAFIGSAGALEIGLNQGNFAILHDIQIGDRVIVEAPIGVYR